MASTLLLCSIDECRVCGGLVSWVRDPTCRGAAWWLVAGESGSRRVTAYACSRGCREKAVTGIEGLELVVTEIRMVRCDREVKGMGQVPAAQGPLPGGEGSKRTAGDGERRDGGAQVPALQNGNGESTGPLRGPVAPGGRGRVQSPQRAYQVQRARGEEGEDRCHTGAD